MIRQAVVPRGGIEPPTLRFSVACSAIGINHFAKTNVSTCEIKNNRLAPFVYNR